MQPLSPSSTDLITRPARSLVGPKIRTSHAQAAVDIPQFWGSLDVPSLFGVGGGEAAQLMAVYFDIESDWQGAYSMLIGVEAPASVALPSGMERLELPSEKVARVSFAATDPSQIMPAWLHVWQRFPQRHHRRYGMDVEILRPTGVLELELTLKEEGMAAFANALTASDGLHWRARCSHVSHVSHFAPASSAAQQSALGPRRAAAHLRPLGS